MAKRRLYYAEFRRRLDGEPLSPAYLFTGPEPFLKEEGARAVLDLALPPEERNLNLERVYADSDVSGQDVKERALTLPFLAGRRVVLVRQVERWRAADLAALESYLAAPSPSSVVILVSGEERIKSEAWRRVADAAVHVECYPLFDNQVPEWIERRARGLGKRMERGAAEELIQRTGTSLSELASEIDKLGLFIGERPAITAGDIEAAAGQILPASVDRLISALCRRRSAAILRECEGLLGEGLAPAQLLGSFSWFFRNLYPDLAAMEQGESAESRAAALKNPNARRDREAALKHYAARDLPGILKGLLRLDEHLKSGRSDWETALTVMILGFAETGRGSGAEKVSAAR